jgi:hypothetical protein
MWFACITYLKLGLDAFTKWKLVYNKSIGLGVLEFGAEFSAIVLVLHKCRNCYYIRVLISVMFNHIYIIYLKHVQRLPVLGVDLSDWLSGKTSSIVDDIFYHTIAKVGLCVKSPQFSLGI